MKPTNIPERNVNNTKRILAHGHIFSSTQTCQQRTSLQASHAQRASRATLLPCAYLRLLGHAPSLRPSAPPLGLRLPALLAGARSAARLRLSRHLLLVVYNIGTRERGRDELPTRGRWVRPHKNRRRLAGSRLETAFERLGTRGSGRYDLRRWTLRKARSRAGNAENIPAEINFTGVSQRPL